MSNCHPADIGNLRLLDVQEQERNRLLAQEIKDYAILMLDADGRIESWSSTAEQLQDYDSEELTGRHFSIFYPAEAVASGLPQQKLQKAAIDGRIEDEGWRLRKDGSRFWAHVVITALFDEAGKVRGYAKLSRDLSERHRYQDSVNHNDQIFQLLVQSVRDCGISMLDVHGTITSWNSGAEAIKRYKAEEIIGQHFSVFYPREDVERGKPEWELREALQAGRLEDEGWRVRKDGTLFWANVLISPIYDAAGFHRGFAKVTRDMSERRRMEGLEHSGARVNEFLAMLGHELRNPLAPIRSAVSIMQMEPLENMSIVRCVNVVDRQLRHLTRLVDDLLDIGRISTGQIVLRTENLQLSRVLGRAIEMASPQFRARGQQFFSNTMPDSITVQGDEVRLVQAVHNLLDNAAKFTPNGGQITLEVVVLAGALQLIVSDNGEGITAANQEQIFNLFVRGGRDGTHAVESGLGLGLTLVRSVVELHGGTVTVSSAGPGQGSRFVVHLPLMTVVASVSETPAEIASAQSDPQQRILVVDDNVDAADSMAVLLRMLGYDVVVAYGGEQALLRLQEHLPSIVLLDIGMPGMDGYQVAARMRSSAGGGSLKLIAVTGFGQNADQQKALSAGFDVHLVKPVDIDVLKELLENVDQ